MARRRRGLTEDDRETWARVAASATPLRPAATLLAPLPDAPDPEPPRPAPAGLPAPRRIVASFRVGQAAPAAPARIDDLLTPAERLREHPLRMDSKTHGRLLRGKLRPEARIDLHGLTLSVAKAELTDFLLHAQASGRRLVLVITGKGKGDHGPLPTRAGALRHEVPHWLHMAPLAQIVMQVVPAHLRHGGGGAYYVYLRRFR